MLRRRTSRRREEVGVSGDPFDVELEDTDLIDEVELTTSLMAAANQSEGRLTAEEIDQLLGLT